MQPKVMQGIMGYRHYSITIEIYIHVADEKYQEEIGKFGKAMGLLNWEKWTILGCCRRFSEVHILKL